MKALYKEKYPHLFTPLAIKRGKNEVVFKNRVIVGPNRNVALMDPFNYINEECIKFYGSFAQGGFAAFCLPIKFPVTPRGSMIIDAEDRQVYNDVYKLQRYVHAYDALSICELNHGGLKELPDGRKISIGPSSAVFNNKPVQEMTPDDMEMVAEMFVQEAQFALRSGFDTIMLHYGHGFLMSSFLSPLTNFRTDQYGGSVENRCRFPLMVLKRVREAIGDVPLEVRLNGTDGGYNIGGITIEDCAEQAVIFSEVADMLNISCGSRVDALSRPFEHSTHYVPPGCNVPASAEVKKKVHNIPVGVVGGIHTPELAEEILAEEKADYIIMARQAIADSEWVNKVMQGREADIRPCIRCNFCTGDTNRNALSSQLISGNLKSNDKHCTVNPLFGQGMIKEKLPKPTRRKKVAVIGGGVAGMQAAITAAANGHEVTLYEKGARLGGQLRTFCDDMSFKKEIKRLTVYMERQLNASGAKVLLQTEATPALIAAEDYDAAIVAVGAQAVIPRIAGVDRENVVIGTDVFGHEDKLGEKVVIIGGGMVGCETAIHLSQKGHKVAIVEMAEHLAATAQLAERLQTMRILSDYGVEEYTNTACREITAQGVLVETSQGERLLEADNVVICIGYRPLAALRDGFSDCAFTVRNIGDCRRVALIGDAIDAGFDAGSTI